MHLPKPAPKTVYITTGACDMKTMKPEYPLDWYRLESRATLSDMVNEAIRIKSPADLMVYKTTVLDIDGTVLTHHFKSADNRSLDSLEWVPIVRMNGKWVPRFDFMGLDDFGKYRLAMKAEGYTAVPILGWLTPKQYQKWVTKGLKKIDQYNRDKMLGIECL